jgi:hypothetical protein
MNFSLESAIQGQKRTNLFENESFSPPLGTPFSEIFPYPYPEKNEFGAVTLSN